ncbi:TPA: restriction endonuclease subunit S [Vibrio parahaemolyticus]|nr:restriction endonuclease subunit S [Vibrio parahaemolyticus]HCG8456077.1 restriction endonuclease subunit S [Vibrio parahaemolyticus]
MGLPIVALKDLCADFKKDIVDGPFGSNLKRSHFTEEGIPVLKIQNIKPFKIEKKKMDFVTLDKFSELERHSFRQGDIVMTKLGSPLGVSAIVDDIQEGVIVADLVRIRASKIDTRYLCYHLNSPVTQKHINSFQKGATRPRVKISVARELPIYTPSESEQKRIVQILDKAFADIDQARVNTEQNLQNARELFDSYLQQVFSERGEGWKKFVFSDLCEITSKLVDPRESEFLDYPHIGAANITSVTGELTEIKTAREEQLKSGKFVFDESMVLYSKIRPYLMKTCRPNFVGLCSADIYPLVPNKELITRDFLFYLLTTQHFTDYAISGSSRAGMPKVNRTHLFNYTCHIPSVEEQDMLVEKLNLMMEKSEELQGIYQSKLAALDELKQSLLQQAFTGQLTQG